MSMRKKVLFSLLTMLLFFAGLEALARVIELWRPPLEVDYGLGFDSESRLFVPDPADSSRRITRPSKRRYFNDASFSAEKPPGTLRIAALGGSTVNMLHAQLHAIGRALQAPLAHRFARVEVINAGGHAYGSHRLVSVLAELLEYDLDVVLLYTGHNEFEEVDQLALSQKGSPRVEEGLAHLAFFRLIRDGVTSARVAVLESEHNARLLSEIPAQSRAWNHPFTSGDLARRMQAYRENLEIMIGLTQRAGVPLIIGTVPSNLFRPMLPMEGNEHFAEVFRQYKQGEYERGMALSRKYLAAAPRRHQSSQSENAAIRELAERHGILLADVEARVIQAEPHGVPGETLFRDHCHLNGKGNLVWRKTFEPILRDMFH